MFGSLITIKFSFVPCIRNYTCLECHWLHIASIFKLKFSSKLPDCLVRSKSHSTVFCLQKVAGYFYSPFWSWLVKFDKQIFAEFPTYVCATATVVPFRGMFSPKAIFSVRSSTSNKQINNPDYYTTFWKPRSFNKLGILTTGTDLGQSFQNKQELPH